MPVFQGPSCEEEKAGCPRQPLAAPRLRHHLHFQTGQARAGPAAACPRPCACPLLRADSQVHRALTHTLRGGEWTLGRSCANSAVLQRPGVSKCSAWYAFENFWVRSSHLCTRLLGETFLRLYNTEKLHFVFLTNI